MAAENLYTPLDPTNETTEVILGQCWVAFGVGAGPIRIGHEAIAALRNRYRQYFEIATENAPIAWVTEGPQVLDYCRSIGRLAAQIATNDGRFAIIAADANEAADRVQAQALQALGREGILGRYCTR